MTHIVRIDKPRPGTVGRATHGWQLRGSGKRGYPSRLFSDSTYGGAEAALAAAQANIKEFEQEFPPPVFVSNCHRIPFLQSSGVPRNNTSGVIGVYYTEYAHRWDKNHICGYWCAFLPKGPSGQTRFHRRFNVERFGYNEARKLAIEFRQEWEKAVLSPNPGFSLTQFFEKFHFNRLVDAGFDSWELALGAT